jgi:hypothetical protein
MNVGLVMRGLARMIVQRSEWMEAAPNALVAAELEVLRNAWVLAASVGIPRPEPVPVIRRRKRRTPNIRIVEPKEPDPVVASEYERYLERQKQGRVTVRPVYTPGARRAA